MKNIIIKTIIQAADNTDVDIDFINADYSDQSVTVQLKVEDTCRLVRVNKSKADYEYFFNTFNKIKNSTNDKDSNN